MATIEQRKQYLQTKLTTDQFVLGEIYIITNTVNNKRYIGQTLSHKLNTKIYRPFGSTRRLNQHTSDALNNTKKKQCSYLNNAIRKNGKDKFTVALIEYCLPEDANNREIHLIKEYNTLYPNGYNLTEGGNKGPTLQGQKEKLMRKSHEQYKEQKLERFKGVKINVEDIDKYIREYSHERYGGTYYVVIIDGTKTMFVGQYLTSVELRQQAIDFIYELARRLQHT